MMRLLFFIFAIIIIDGSEGLGVLPLREYEVVHVVDNHNTCSRHEARLCADAFVSCFIDRKDRNRPNLFNIVPRLLDRSKACIKFANRECRPSYDGFVLIMGKVIDMIKAYSSMHLERLVKARVITYAERDKIKDLNCVENSLTKDIYTACFDTVISTYEDLLDENEAYDLIFQKEVEKAIICTNIANPQCSRSVKIDLNKIVRYILGIRPPKIEDIQNDRKSFEIPSPNEPGKLPLEIRKTEQEDIDDDSETSKFIVTTSYLDSTDFIATEQENIEVIFKIKRPSESRDFSEAESDEVKPNNFTLHSRETETTTFIERTTFTNTPKPEKQNSKNNTNLPNEPVITESTLSLELIKSTEFPEFNSSKSLNTVGNDNDPQFTETPQFLKTTQSPKQNHLNSKGADGSKDIAASENGKDIIIDLSDWEKESATFTEPSQPLMNTDSPNLKNLQNSTVFNSSTDRADEKTKEAIVKDLSDDKKSTTFTYPPLLLMMTESSSLNLTNFTGFDSSNDRVIAETEENLMIELSDEEKSITHTETTELLKTTESPKIKDLRNSTVADSTLPRTPNVHTATEIKKDIVTEPVVMDWEAKSTASTKLPKSSDLPKSTASIMPLKPTDFPKSTVSTKDPKLRNPPKSTTPTKPPKPTDPPKSTTTTRRPTPSAPVRSRTRNIPFDPPRPTEAPKHWYDFIVQPIVSLWRTIKSWFGF